MPSSSSVDTRTFKQRKSFGKYFISLFILKKRNSFCFKATRKEEVAGIRSKFANSKFFVLQYFLNNQNLHYFRNSRDCRTIS